MDSRNFFDILSGKIQCIINRNTGLQRAVKWLYQMGDRDDGKYLEQQGDNWNPTRVWTSMNEYDNILANMSSCFCVR